MLNELVERGITPGELEKIKGNMWGNSILDLEDSANQASHNGANLILFRNPEKIVPYKKLFATFYAKITVKMVNSIIRKYLLKDKMFVVLMGEHPPKLEEVKKCCGKFLRG
jgi:hypothetical protein